MAAQTSYGFAPSSAAFTLNATTPGLQVLPGAIRLPNGNLAVFYGSPGALLARIVGADGRPVGAEITISTNVRFDIFRDGAVPAAVLSNGSVVVAWVDNSSPTNVLFRLYDQNLAPLTSALPGESGSISYIAPDVAALNDGGFVIALEGVYSATDHDIRFQRFDSAGAMAGALTSLSTTLDLDELPAVAGLRGGGFAVAFDRAGANPVAFLAVRDADGGERLAAQGFDFGGANTQLDVVGLANEGFLTIHSDTGWGGAGGSDLTATRFSPAGVQQARLHASAIPVASEFQPAAAVSPDGFAAIAYFSTPAGNSDVFVSLIDPAGTLVRVDARLLGTAGGENFPSLAWVDRAHVFIASVAQAGAAGFDDNNGGVAGQVFEVFRTIAGDGANDAITVNADGIINHVNGGGGNDVIISGAGADILFGGEGVDTLYAGAGADYLQADGGASSILVGEGGADTIYGGAGNDYCVGGEGDDVIVGLGGVDSLYGGAGADYLVAGDGVGCVVDGGAGANSLWGAGGADYMVGGEGADLMVGGAGADYLFGNQGADTLYGGAATDYVFGNAGNDFIWTDDAGGAPSTDYLYVGGGTGIDTVADFTPGAGVGHDVVVVSPASGVASFAQAQAAMVQAGVYTVLTMSGGDQLYLYNVQPFQMTPENFLFF